MCGDTHVLFENVKEEEKSKINESTMQEEISSMLLQLNSLQKQCDEIEVLSEVQKHINSALMTVQASLASHSNSEYTCDIPIKKRCFPNANNEKPQKHFYLTRRNRKKMQTGCKKQTNEEILSSKQVLSSFDILVCSVCLRKMTKLQHQATL